MNNNLEEKINKVYLFLILLNFLLMFYFLQKLNNLTENNLENKRNKIQIEKILSFKKEYYTQKDFYEFYNKFDFKDFINVNKLSNKIEIFNEKIDNKIIDIILKELLNNNYYIDKLEIKKINEKESYFKVEVLNEEKN